MTPELLTAFSLRIAEGQVILLPELCEHLVLQVILRSGVKGPAIARNIGVDRRTINRYERGNTMPPLDNAVKILNDLGYDLVVRKR